MKSYSGVNVTPGALPVAVYIVVKVSGTLSHCHTGGVNIHISLALTTNTTNGGVYLDVLTVP